MNNSLAKPDLSLYDLIDATNVRNIFVNNPNMLVSWCENMQRGIIDRNLQADIYVGLQSVRPLKPILPGYRKMATAARKVWVFGVTGDDIIQTPTLHCVYLSPEARLMQEWFLIIKHPEFSQALVAREIGGQGTLQNDHYFQGTIVTDAVIVDLLVNRLEQAIASALGAQQQ